MTIESADNKEREPNVIKAVYKVHSYGAGFTASNGAFSELTPYSMHFLFQEDFQDGARVQNGDAKKRSKRKIAKLFL